MLGVTTDPLVTPLTSEASSCNWNSVCGPTAAVPVALNVTGLPASVPDVAVTVLTPAAEPNVSVADACPCAFVVTGVALKLPPPEVTANVTATPDTALPLAPVTSTVNGFASN